MDNENLMDNLSCGVSRRGYFVMAENAFLNKLDLTIYEKMVFLSLCTYAGKSNACFPGQKGIAKNLGISVRTVNTTIKSLEDKSGLIIIKQYTETNRKTVNMYMLADIDQKTGEFIKESLDIYRSLADKPRQIRGK